MANYSTLVEVAASALGGKKETKPTRREDVDEDLTQLSAGQYLARFDQLLSFG
jgi:hypothetical protein